MTGELVEATTPPPPALERARPRVARVRALLPGALAAALVATLGLTHGGYFPTAWGPLALVFLAASAVALLVRPRPSLDARRLALPALLALLAAWALASAAWGSPTEAVPEARRALAYAAGALAFALVLRRERVAGVLAGIWVGICIVALDALAGRLFPERFGEYDPIGGYRLSEPVGYWNALGLLSVFGLLLALGLVARAESLLVRLAAAASTVPVALALYFTFSRGAWLSLFAGLLAVLVLDPRRLQMAAALLLVAPWPGLAVGLASRSGPLTETGHPLAAASSDGHALAATATGLALAAAGTAAFSVALGPRVRLSAWVSRAANAALAAGLLAAVALVVAALGGPVHIARSFAAPPRAIEGDLNERLFDLSGNGRVDGWRVALDEVREHPFVGSGGGSFERYWNEQRPYAGVIRDAHSLYLEVLAELGPIGLVLVLALFAVPLGLAIRFRHCALVPASAGVVVAYVAHAGIDWDWEFPVLTLVALGSAAAIVASGGNGAVPAAFGRRAAALLALLALLVPAAALGALGARAEAASADAFDDRDYDRAADEARRAEGLVPWSVQPLLLLGRAHAGAGDRAAARQAFSRALEREPDSWRLWYELAAVSRGTQRKAALREARSLNPLEPLLAELSGDS